MHEYNHVLFSLFCVSFILLIVSCRLSGLSKEDRSRLANMMKRWSTCCDFYELQAFSPVNLLQAFELIQNTSFAFHLFWNVSDVKNETWILIMLLVSHCLWLTKVKGLFKTVKGGILCIEVNYIVCERYMPGLEQFYVSCVMPMREHAFSHSTLSGVMPLGWFH